MVLYKGRFVSNAHFSSGGGGRYIEYGKVLYESIEPTIGDLTTDEAVYEMLFDAVTIDYENPDDIGLWRIILWIETDEKKQNDANYVYTEPDIEIGANYAGRANELEEESSTS